MLTVTALRESTQQPGRVQVTLSDQRTFTVAIATISDARLTHVGAPVDEALAARLGHEHAVNALMARAVASLARGRKTRFELQQRLRRVEPDRELVTEALDRLERSGVLSETEVSRSEASARLRRGEGPARVRQRLQQKGIARRVAEAAVDQAAQDDAFDELAACRQVASKRAASLARFEPAVARRRLTMFLRRRGYGASVIRTVLAEMRQHPRAEDTAE